MRTSTVLCFLTALVFLLAHQQQHHNGGVDAAISTTELVTEFPHFQTFDSWEMCRFFGPCFAQACDELAGGWYNEAFHGTEAPFNESVRHWWVNKGPTTSNYYYNNNTFYQCEDVRTGPCYDHTLNNETGGYLYAEASACQRSYMHVLSPPVRFSNSGALVSFWYFMRGGHLDNSNRGRLEVAVSVNEGNWITFFNFSGRAQFSSSEPWIQYNQTLDGYFPSNVNVNNTVTAQFRFRAYIGGTDDQHWRADIAFDDVLFTQAGASSVLVPYIDPPPRNNTEPPGPTVIDEGGDGITDAQIAGIVVGVVGGLLLCCLLLTILVVVLLLLISPRKPQGRSMSPDPDL